jgi:L-lactate dehydrogenase
MTEVEGVPDVALSLPHIIGRKGIEMTILPTLNAEEHAALKQSATIIKTHLQSIQY